MTYGSKTLSRYFFSLALEMSKRDHKVVFITDQANPNIIKQEGNPIILTWPSKRPTKPKDFFFALKVLQKYSIDCVIANFGSVNMLMLTSYLLKIPVRAAYYHTLSETFLKQYSTNNFVSKLKRHYKLNRKRLIYAMATHIISVSEIGKKDCSKLFSINPSKIIVRPYSIEDPLYRIQNFDHIVPPSQREIDIISVATLSHHKGIDILIKAVRILKQDFPQLRVIIIGSGPESDKYKSMTQFYKLNENITFTGSMKGTTVINFILNSKILVLPSRTDNYPAVLLEALSCGTPVVATKIGGIPEIIQHDVTGLLVPPENSEELANAIYILLRNKQKLNNFGNNARKIFRRKHYLKTSIQNDVLFWENLVLNTHTRKIFEIP